MFPETGDIGATPTVGGAHLEEDRAPKRKVGELDNRGSHFYLALYWAQALAQQDVDPDLATRFAELAQQLADNEEKIVKELSSVQGSPVEIDGYYRPDSGEVAAAMRPSDTLNEALEALQKQSA